MRWGEVLFYKPNWRKWFNWSKKKKNKYLKNYLPYIMFSNILCWIGWIMSMGRISLLHWPGIYYLRRLRKKFRTKRLLLPVTSKDSQRTNLIERISNAISFFIFYSYYFLGSIFIRFLKMIISTNKSRKRRKINHPIKRKLLMNINYILIINILLIMLIC